jgi:type VI secretion system secreted protein Hcp
MLTRSFGATDPSLPLLIATPSSMLLGRDRSRSGRRHHIGPAAGCPRVQTRLRASVVIHWHDRAARKNRCEHVCDSRVYAARKPSSMVCRMAETVHLYLKRMARTSRARAPRPDNGRENSIECLIVQGQRPHRPRARQPRGCRSPRARADRDHQAHRQERRRCWRRRCAATRRSRGQFLFFRPNPAGDGTTEQFFTVEIQNGRVDSIERISPNAHDPAASNAPPMEIVRMVYHTIRWVYVPTGAEYVDTWDKSDGG